MSRDGGSTVWVSSLNSPTVAPLRPPLCEAFLKWQCRVRQIAMRENAGRPDDAILPELLLPGQSSPLGHVVTVINRAPEHSVTAELMHIARQTHDPNERRDKAAQFFSAGYYQKHHEFSDQLTATFPPGSPGAAKIHESERCTLVFFAYAQRFALECEVIRLANEHPLYEAAYIHNYLFNPHLSPRTEILGFIPDWENSTADPDFEVPSKTR